MRINMDVSAKPRAARQYRGHSTADRAEARRERLLQAAISVYGEFGFHAATVQAVCSAAGLTKRYFYESFADSEALLAACFRSVSSALIAELAATINTDRPSPEGRSAAILTAYFRAIQADPVRARLFLLETDGLNSSVVQAMYAAQGALAQLIIDDDHSVLFCSSERRLQGAGAVAGVARISVVWVAENYATPLEEVVRAAHALFDGLVPRARTLLVLGG